MSCTMLVLLLMLIGDTFRDIIGLDMYTALLFKNIL